MVDRERKKVTRMEVIKAIHSLSAKKASGPDKFSGEVYERPPGLAEPLTELLNLVYSTGHIPKALRQAFLIPLPKSGKDPHDTAPRRPITLLNTAAKLIEAVVYHRILPQIEPRLSPAQYASRTNCSTEMCMTEIMDAAHRGLRRGRWCYLASLDIAGAFDNVSHSKLAEAVKTFGVDGHSRRLLKSNLQS